LRRLIETRSQALAAVSHDLRLPLTRVRLRLEQLGDAPLRTALENDIAEMDQMIGGTLEYLRGGRSSERCEPVDLGALLDSVAADMEALGVEVRLHLPPRVAVAPLAVRPQALARCLRNLVDNAGRYGGGRVDLRLDDDDQQVVIRVEDRGPGIPATERERLFEPFVRLESSRARHTGGTGLGLTIARAIARAHGGDVVIAERIGGGTCVIVSLPRRVEETVESTA
jgi:signal transduction histidine kinase